MNITDLPFNQHIGLEKDEAALKLKKRDTLLNHIGSMHAAAIYGLAESASGDYIISRVLPLFPDALVLVREGTIRYKRPAEDDCLAEVSVGEDAFQDCIRALERDKRASISIPVSIESGGRQVALATFDWWFGLK